MTKQITPEAAAISADVQAALSGEEGLSAKLNNDIYYAHGKTAGYEAEVIDGVKGFDRTFAAGSMDGVAKAGLAHVLKTGSKEPVSVTVPGSKGEEFTATYTPHSSGVMKGAEGQPDREWEAFGGIRVTHRTLVRGKGGDMGAAMAASAAAAEAVFKASK